VSAWGFEVFNPKLIAIADSNRVSRGLGGPGPLPPENPTIEPWPEPKPLTKTAPPEPYPIEAIPEIIRAAIEEVNDFHQTPIALTAVSALSLASVASQGYVDVARAVGFTGPVGLFFLTLAESGERKSSVDTRFRKPLDQFEAAKRSEFKHQQAKFEAENADWENKVQRGRSELSNESTSSGAKTKSNLENHYLVRPTPPSCQRLLYSDITPEALRENLSKRLPVGAIISSEAGIVFGSHGMNPESITRNLSQLNVLWDGIDLQSDRKQDSSYIHVQNPRFSMSLQVQPEVIRGFLSRAGALARGSGFLARFLVAQPQSTIGTRIFKDPPANWDNLNRYHARIATLLELPYATDETGRLSPRLLTFSSSAKISWVKAHDEIERMLADGEELRVIRDFGSKAADNIARLAAILHFVQHGYETEINVDSVNSAISIVSWHLHETKRVFPQLTMIPQEQNACEIEKFLKRECNENGLLMYQLSNMNQKGPSKFRDSAGRSERDAAIQLLESRHRVRRMKEGGIEYVQVNTKLLEDLSVAT